MREMSSLIYNASEDQIIRARNQLKASILYSQDGPGGAPRPAPILATQLSPAVTPTSCTLACACLHRVSAQRIDGGGCYSLGRLHA
jgi:hypothetical protein